MHEPATKARLVDSGSFGGDGVATTLARTEIEETLRQDADGADLVLDVARGERRETIAVAWDRADLEELLRRTPGDKLTLTFDASELEHAIDEDVEAHGVREKALMLTVVAAAATAGAAQARPYIEASDVAGPTAGVVQQASTADAMLTDASTSGGGAYAGAAGTDATVTDASTSGAGAYAGAAAGTDATMTDASTGGYAVPAPGAGDAMISDVASGGADSFTAATSGPADSTVSDAATSGAGGYVPAASDAAGSDSAITMPSARDAGLIGGLALLITGAGFAARRRGVTHKPAERRIMVELDRPGPPSRPRARGRPACRRQPTAAGVRLGASSSPNFARLTN